jgi:hypothetical protein
VDIYYNDVYCLTESIQSFRKEVFYDERDYCHED